MAPLKRAGYFEDQISVEVFWATDKQAAPVKEMDDGLKNSMLLPNQLHVKTGAITLDLLKRYT